MIILLLRIEEYEGSVISVTSNYMNENVLLLLLLN